MRGFFALRTSDQGRCQCCGAQGKLSSLSEGAAAPTGSAQGRLCPSASGTSARSSAVPDPPAPCPLRISGTPKIPSLLSPDPLRCAQERGAFPPCVVAVPQKGTVGKADKAHLRLQTLVFPPRPRSGHIFTWQGLGLIGVGQGAKPTCIPSNSSGSEVRRDLPKRAHLPLRPP